MKRINLINAVLGLAIIIPASQIIADAVHGHILAGVFANGFIGLLVGLFLPAYKVKL